ncbi:MAG: hypothetical protein HY360_07545 [Verrucomicrobia bacterium]|nr:hypothetical protein [Verrucomicrobiota bacterium]
MKNEIVKTPPQGAAEIVVEPGITEQFAQARTYLQMAKLSFSQGAAFMILTGFELKRLYKLHGIRRGKPRNCRNVAIIKWEPLIKRELQISLDTALRYMQMADAAKKRLPNINADELLSTPLKDLPDLRRQTLIASVQKITDGETAQQLMWDWGIAKKPIGHRLMDGSLDRSWHPRKPVTPEELARAEEQASLDMWKPTIHELEFWGLEKKTWAHLPRAEMEKLHGALIDLSREVGAALKGGKEA